MTSVDILFFVLVEFDLGVESFSILESIPSNFP